MTDAGMHPVLEGVTVIDLSRFIAGPYCAAMLADFGARVIRVERPGGGEDRQLLSMEGAGDAGALFMQVNRNKESVTLDMTTPAGADIFRRLVRESDVVVQNLPPRVLCKLGQDHESLAKINPRIILASITAFGSRGPKADQLGFDGIAQAVSGAIYLGGDEAQPMKSPSSYVDFGAGVAAAFGVMAALMAREKTGRGQLVESSLLGTALASFSPYLIEQAVAAPNRKPQGNRSQIAAPADLYRTRDGWIIVQILGHDMFTRWTKLVGAERMATDPRFATDTLRAKNAREIGDAMSAWSSGLASADAVARLQRANIPAAEVLSPAQVIADEHVRASGLLQNVNYPGLPGDVPVVASPVVLSDTPGTVRCRPPQAGEHTDDVLRWLGYADDDVAGLRASRVV
ncbi:CaiB/BaiF CoA transferase family protein [Ramlibacter sp.]|uniref:CaiB/BaiF CoA transferase family protein n=1 Tax=Ramlibacter sp. TaxID=1917967 RepID=UPI003D153460